KTHRQARCPPAPQTRCLCYVSVYHPLTKTAVRIDASIPQKWPVRALFVHAVPFHIGHHDLFLIDETFCDDFAVWPANETLSPKFNPIPTRGRFMAYSVWDCDVAAIR